MKEIYNIHFDVYHPNYPTQTMKIEVVGYEKMKKTVDNLKKNENYSNIEVVGEPEDH